MGGGSKTSTTVNTSPEERAYQKAQTDLAVQQLQLTQQQHGWQSEIFALTKPLLEKYSLLTNQQLTEYNSPEAAANRLKGQQLETAQLDQTIRNMPVQDELLQRQLDEIRRGGAATDEQKRLIGDVTNRALDAGTSDVRNALDYGLRDIREQLAPARGMRPDDAPIQDAGQRLALEALRQQGVLTSNLRGAQANAELNFPLNASQLTSSLTQFQQQFGTGMNQFMQQLRQQALSNRNAFSAQLFTSPMAAGEQGIGLINASRPTPVSFARSETTKQSGGGFASALGGIGGLLSGVGSLFSSRDYKTDIRPVAAGGPERTLGSASTDEDMLKRVASLPVSEWRYKPGFDDGTRHVGPMAEDFATRVMGKPPQRTIDTVDAIGSLMSSVKALERRTRRTPMRMAA